jgi:apolipoprotein N-acyltransferase
MLLLNPKIMNLKKALLLSILSGLLFVMAWPVNGFPIVIFAAFVPLLFVEKAFASKTAKKAPWLFFALSYLTFLIWNLGTTWWLINSTLFGMLFANLCSAVYPERGFIYDRDGARFCL